jgi:hypothetical protein
MTLAKVTIAPIFAISIWLYSVGAYSQTDEPSNITPEEVVDESIAENVVLTSSETEVPEYQKANSKFEQHVGGENLKSLGEEYTADRMALGISVVALAIGFFNIICTFYYRREDRNSSIIDNFWLREVIIPEAIKPLNEELLNNKYRFIKTLSNKEISTLIASMDELKQKLSIVAVISLPLTEVIEEIIDNLSISIVNRSNPQLVYCAKAASVSKELEDPYLESYKKSIAEIISAHKRTKNIT